MCKFHAKNNRIFKFETNSLKLNLSQTRHSLPSASCLFHLVVRFYRHLRNLRRIHCKFLRYLSRLSFHELAYLLIFMFPIPSASILTGIDGPTEDVDRTHLRKALLPRHWHDHSWTQQTKYA